MITQDLRYLLRGGRKRSPREHENFNRSRGRRSADLDIHGKPNFHATAQAGLSIHYTASIVGRLQDRVVEALLQPGQRMSEPGQHRIGRWAGEASEVSIKGSEALNEQGRLGHGKLRSAAFTRSHGRVGLGHVAQKLVGELATQARFHSKLAAKVRIQRNTAIVSGNLVRHGSHHGERG
jgi:hypothetical protein